MRITIGARNSLLSKAQVAEVYQEIAQFFPEVQFLPIWVTTSGDLDKTTSLRKLEKTNFFTDAIDARQYQGEFRISIHSAKDLPDPLHKGLQLVALTRGKDPSDVLVLRNPDLPDGARIGTSSLRREEFLKNLRPDVTCVDIRGTIEERLALLDQGVLDGVVMARCALERLNIMDRPYLPLDIQTPVLQGRLAVIACQDDEEMKQLFQKIHTE